MNHTGFARPAFGERLRGDLGAPWEGHRQGDPAVRRCEASLLLPHGADPAQARDLDDRVVRSEAALACDLRRQRLKPARLHLVHAATRGTKQELTSVGVVGMVARQVGLGGLQPVHEAGSHDFAIKFRDPLPMDGDKTEYAIADHVDDSCRSARRRRVPARIR